MIVGPCVATVSIVASASRRHIIKLGQLHHDPRSLPCIGCDRLSPVSSPCVCVGGISVPLTSVLSWGFTHPYVWPPCRLSLVDHAMDTHTERQSRFSPRDHAYLRASRSSTRLTSCGRGVQCRSALGTLSRSSPRNIRPAAPNPAAGAPPPPQRWHHWTTAQQCATRAISGIR